MNTVPLTLKCLFSSELRVKVLSHFFFHPGEDFHIRRLASVLKEPPGTLARELSHLEKAGIQAQDDWETETLFAPKRFAYRI